MELLNDQKLYDAFNNGDIKFFEQLQQENQKEIFEKLIKRSDKDNENHRKILGRIWSEIAEDIKTGLDSSSYNRLIETMENDPKRMAAVWKNTPEEIKIREGTLLDRILECTIDDTKRYLSIWYDTPQEVQEQNEADRNKMDVLNQLQGVNSKVIDTISLRMLDNKYTSTLNLQQLQMITCYPDVQKKLLSLTDQQYNVMIQALSNVKDMQQWRYEFNQVLNNVEHFDGLIENITELQNGSDKNIDYYKVLMVLHQKNYFNVQSYQDVENFDQTKANLYEAIKSNNLEALNKYNEIEGPNSTKFILLEYLYNIDIETAQHIIKRYGTDIMELSDNDENTQLKEIITQIKSILEARDESEILAFFQDQRYVKTDIDNIKLEIGLKKAYAEEYNNQLTNVSDMQRVSEEEKATLGFDGVRVYDAGVDFNIMITSIAPYNSNNPKDFYQDWNRKETQSQGFCCSYIRNDMLGHAAVPHLCYGFSSMSKDSLTLSSVDDMGSNTSSGIVEETGYNNVRFYTPNNQIDRVYDESGYGFNEMVYNRIQNGAKKQPDYIVAFMREGKIENIEKIKMAVEQYRARGIDLPVVIVNEDACIESEKNKIKDMIKSFETEPTLETFLQIKQKVKNNSVANQFEFEEFSNYLHNEYEDMKNCIMTRNNDSETQKDSSEKCVEKFKHCYEYKNKLSDRAKHRFLEIREKIMKTIKSISTTQEKAPVSKEDHNLTKSDR